MSDLREQQERAHRQKSAAHQPSGNHQTLSSDELCQAVCNIIQDKSIKSEVAAFRLIRSLFYPI